MSSFFIGLYKFLYARVLNGNNKNTIASPSVITRPRVQSTVDVEGIGV